MNLKEVDMFIITQQENDRTNYSLFWGVLIECSCHYNVISYAFDIVITGGLCPGIKHIFKNFILFSPSQFIPS